MFEGDNSYKRPTLLLLPSTLTILFLENPQNLSP